MVFHSACSRLISAAAASQSVDPPAPRPGRERFLLREILAPRDLALGEIGLAAGEEAVAGGAEALPHGLFLAARDRPDGLHSACSCLISSAADPVGRVGDALRRVRRARPSAPGSPRAAGLGGEKRLAARPELVVRRLEPSPSARPAPAARRPTGATAPAARGSRARSSRGPRPRSAPPSSRRAAPARRVRESLPVLGVAQLLDLRRERRLRRLEPMRRARRNRAWTAAAERRRAPYECRAARARPL